MATAPVTSAEVALYEYLHSDYSPDREYVDGVIEERHLGELDHSDLQGELVTLFRNHRNEWHVRAYPELRVQVSATRYRVPDVCLLREGQRRTPIVVEAPLLCIEILPPEDRFGRIRKKCDEYLAMGVLEGLDHRLSGAPHLCSPSRRHHDDAQRGHPEPRRYRGCGAPEHAFRSPG